MLIVSATGALVGAIVNQRLAWPVAFGLGVLPVATVRSFIFDRTLRALKLPRSNLEWRVILDLCDQAVLLVYLGEKTERIRPLGIRSAGELAALNWFKDDPAYFTGFTLEDAVREIAALLEMQEPQVRMLISTLSEDVTVSLLATLWSDDTPGQSNDEEEDDGAEEGQRQE